MDGTAVVGVYSAHMLLRTTNDSPVMYEYEALAPFHYAPLKTSSVGGYIYITTDSAYQEECFHLLQCISTEEGSMAARYGKEGVDWQWGKDYDTGNVAVDVINASALSGQTKSTWGVAFGITTKYGPTTKYHTAITSSEMTWSQARTQKNNEHAAAYLAVAEANNPDQIVDWTLAYSEAESSELGNIRTDVLTYVRESRAKFASGEWDPASDTDWNNYVKTYESMGVDTLLKVSQSAYDRYMGN